MSARANVQTRNRIRATPTALCRWEHAPHGGLRATWRVGCRVAPGADAGGSSSPAAARLTDRQQVDALANCAGKTRQRPARRWIAGGFIAALYLLVAFAGIAIVGQV